MNRHAGAHAGSDHIIGVKKKKLGKENVRKPSLFVFQKLIIAQKKPNRKKHGHGIIAALPRIKQERHAQNKKHDRNNSCFPAEKTPGKIKKKRHRKNTE